MMDCCDNGINDIGCFQSCDIVEIGVLATQTGLYTIELQPTGTQIFQTTNTAGTPLVFSNGFNEDGVSVFKIKQPDDTYLSVDGKECFQIQNSVAKNPALADVNVEPVTCPAGTAKNTEGIVIASIPSGAEATITDGAARNSTSTYSLAVPAETTKVIADTPVRKSDLVLIANAPSGVPYTVANSLIRSSSSNFLDTVKATDPYTIADVSFTQSDGTPHTAEYGQPIVCTPGGCSFRTTNLYTHWDTFGLVNNTTNAYGIVGALDNCSQVTDLTGNGRHLTQATGGFMPTRIAGMNGGSALSFDGSDWLVNTVKADWEFLHTTQYTVILLFKKIGTSTNPGARYGLFGNSGFTLNNVFGFCLIYDDVSYNNGIRYYIFRNNVGNFVNSPNDTSNFFRPNVPELMIVRGDCAGSVVNANENNFLLSSRLQTTVSDVVNAAAAGNPTYDLQLGAIGNNEVPGIFEFQEGFIYNAFLTEDQCAPTLGYLNAKWAIP